METIDIICMAIAFFACLAFALDLLGAAWAAIRKKDYQSLLGQFVEKFANNPALWWLPVLIAILFGYGIHVIYVS